ncbi:DUF2958 domain-containing protein [Jatrophihabitans endophyticus]|uniref:DUF2958 domain-containing protein n=1 Tax=Jatrophihabitans endophyticus TaxID=1206085 RepID=UPI0009FC5DF7|nr:DUF2958 domain-containing protein [Jatrophihabitans endophyticus]
MNETQRERRGHAFLPDVATLAQIPDLYGTEDTDFSDKEIHLKFFCGAATWLIAELDPDSLLAFGHANLGDEQMAEWGYVSVVELEELAVSTPYGFTLVVERDVHWTPKLYRDI